MECLFIRAMEEHFENHRIMTDEEFEKIKKEDGDRRSRQEFLLMDGGLEASLLDFTDLP